MGLGVLVSAAGALIYLQVGRTVIHGVDECCRRDLSVSPAVRGWRRCSIQIATPADVSRTRRRGKQLAAAAGHRPGLSGRRRRSAIERAARTAAVERQAERQIEQAELERELKQEQQRGEAAREAGEVEAGEGARRRRGRNWSPKLQIRIAGA